MYNSVGICLALAAFLASNLCVTMLVGVAWRALLSRQTRKFSAARRAQLLFILRVFPAAVSIICVVALVVPSYLMYEPRESGESIGAKLVILALVSLCGIVFALWRGLNALLATRQLTSKWLREAAPVHFDGITVPSYRIEHSFPVIAIVGIIRPRLFVAGSVFGALNKDELRAAIEHEAGHVSSRDNLKRWLLVICHNLFIDVPGGRAIDRAWKNISELAADEYAARRGGTEALDLAAALVKVARLVPESVKQITEMNHIAAHLIEMDASGIAARVERLTTLAEEESVRGDDRSNGSLIKAAWDRYA